MLTALISLIPKPDKDTMHCSSYCPISLLNVDIKLLAKTLASRFSPYFTTIIHADQIGFIPGQEARDNTTKTIHLIKYIRKHFLLACLLSVDSENTFERGNWQFLGMSLEQIGMGHSFIS